MLEKLSDGIYRICIPFDDIYTTAFVLVTDDAVAVIDSGESAHDAEKYIIPELNSLEKDVRYIIATHSHSDHSGGEKRLVEEYKSATRVNFSKASPFKDGDILLSRFKLISARGHSDDGLMIFDTHSDVLITGDALQQRGISKYRGGVTNPEEYLKDIERVRSLSPSILIASHDYDPFGYIARGKDEIEALLKECISAI